MSANSKHYDIIGIDGEGYWNTDENSHKYDILTVGRKTVRTNGAHLNIHRAISLIREVALSSIANGRIPVFISYFFNYDFYQLIRSLDNHELWDLYKRSDRTQTNPTPKNYPRYRKPSTRTRPTVVDRGSRFSKYRYRVDYLPSKYVEFKFPDEASLPRARRLNDEKAIKWVRVRIQDVGTIFSGSFISAMKSMKIPMTVSEQRMLEDGKAGRSIQATKSERVAAQPEIIEYNRLEIRLIYRLIATMVEKFYEMGYTLDVERHLSGIGAMAGEFLNQRAQSSEITPSWEVAETVSPTIYKFANDAFYGGWFETMRPGICNGLYQVDITSAYPHRMRSLPSLKDAMISRVSGLEHLYKIKEWMHPDSNEKPIIFVDIAYKSTQEYIGALPHRTPEGNVLRPVIARGRFLWSEVEASIRAGLLDEDSIVFYEGYAIYPQSPEKPFAFIDEMFRRRVEVGKKTVEGVMLKILMNSMYGKLAQSVGSPRYANPIWAAMITAEARIMLMDAIGTHPNGIRACRGTATDAVFFDSPHPYLDETPNTLGAWETDFYEKAFMVKSGIWGGMKDGVATALGEADPYDSWDVKTRGISYKSFVSKIGSHIIPELVRMEETSQWDSECKFSTENTFSMNTLGAAAARGDIRKVGEFEVGDHGLPEMVREVSFNLEPKRRDIKWCHETGSFTSKTAFIVGRGIDPFPVSASRPSMIGSVAF